MAEERTQRRLAAVLAADVVGYSRLMEADETGTLAALKARRQQVLEPLVARYQGRVFKVAGDGVLVEFASAVNAVACAVDLQHAMATANDGQPEERHVILRIGVNLGDVMVEGGDLYGDGVNIAARLEAIAEPGSVIVSGTAFDHIKSKVKVGFSDIGPQTLKNIAEPVRAYRVTGTPAVAGTMPASASDKPSIAVLRFVNLSGDVEQQYFSDGLTEDIITELSRFRQIRVLANMSESRSQIGSGRNLGVGYLLEGSVRRLGERIRITVQLIDANSGSHLWAEHYDRDQRDIFAVQDLVVGRIVATLVGRLQATSAEAIKRKPPANLAAYECVLRGDNLDFSDPARLAEARRLFAKATDLDPEYARAYAHLAAVLHLEWYNDINASHDLLDQAVELAKKAVALDRNDGFVHSVAGSVYLTRQSYDSAGQHYGRALELNRNRPQLLASLGLFHAYLGQSDQGLSYCSEAKSLDPFFEPGWYWENLGVVQFTAGDYDEAIAAFLRAPSSFWSQGYLAACHALAGRNDRAKAAAAASVRLCPGFSAKQFAAKEPFKRPEDRQRLLDGLLKAGLPE